MYILVILLGVAGLFLGLGILARPFIIPWLEHMGLLQPEVNDKKEDE